MTDKKQIIIDGIDVSKCQDFYISSADTKCCNCDSDNTQFLPCKANPNCYYKQLAYKIQEKEQLQEENDRYREALEEIKELIAPVANKNPVYNCWELLNKCDGCRSKKNCGAQSPYYVAKHILDIINKAKEEINVRR